MFIYLIFNKESLTKYSRWSKSKTSLSSSLKKFPTFQTINDFEIEFNTALQCFNKKLNNPVLFSEDVVYFVRLLNKRGAFEKAKDSHVRFTLSKEWD